MAIKRLHGLAVGAGEVLGAYVTLATVLGALFTFLVRALQPFKQQGWGWPEAIFGGVLMSCFVLLMASIALIAWRQFRPLPATVQDAAPVQRETLSDSNVGTPTLTFDHLSSAVFVARMEFDVHRLKDDYLVRFLVLVFNGTPERLEIVRPTGALGVRPFKSEGPFTDLPRPLFSEDDIYVGPFRDRFISYDQQVPGALAEQILEWVEGPDGMEVNVEGLTATLVSASRDRPVPLKLWSALRVFRQKPHIMTGRITRATMNVTIGAGATVKGS